MLSLSSLKVLHMEKMNLKAWAGIWKACFGIILMFIGLKYTIQDSNYWMLIFFALGLLLFFIDRKKVMSNKSNKTMIIITITVCLMQYFFD